MMETNPPSRSILITGAASGLGLGLATCALAAGHSVILVDRDSDALARASSTLGAAPERVRTQCVDLANEDQIDAAMNDLSDVAIDVLINNAGLQFVSPLESFPTERWDVIVDVILRGSFLLSRSVIPGMRQRGYGRIVNIGSIHSEVASPFKSAYVAAKHGLLGLTKVIALETADTDITANTISPAYIYTPLVEKQIAAQAEAHKISPEEIIQRIMLAPMPKKAFITIEEVAGAVAFLMSDSARNITGQNIIIDGGWTAQ